MLKIRGKLENLWFEVFLIHLLRRIVYFFMIIRPFAEIKIFVKTSEKKNLLTAEAWGKKILNPKKKNYNRFDSLM